MMMHNLSDAIEREAGEVLGLDRNSEDWPAVSQVKEKFGLLRYHCFSVDKSIRKLIDEAEENKYSGECSRFVGHHRKRISECQLWPLCVLLL
jgi:hypothetical protein